LQRSRLRENVETDEDSISAGDDRVFRVYLIGRAVGTLFLSAGVSIFALGFSLAVEDVLSEITPPFYPDSILVVAIFPGPAAVSCLLVACGLVLAIVGLWKHFIGISGAGIRYRTLALSPGMFVRWPVFENRFALWEEVIGIRRIAGREWYVLLADGHHIDVSLVSGKGEIGALVSASLERIGRSFQPVTAVSKSKRVARIGIPVIVVLAVPLATWLVVGHADREVRRMLRSQAIHDRLDLPCVYGQRLDITFRPWDRPLTGDVTGDGKKDLIVNPRQIRISETYGPSLEYGVPGLIYERVENGFVRSHLKSGLLEADRCSILAVGDFDDDARIELLLVMGDNTMELLEWKGRQFEPVWEGLRPEALVQPEGALSVGDFDGDGRDEIAVLHSGELEGDELEKRIGILGWDGARFVPECNAVCGWRRGLLLTGAGDSNHDGIDEFYLVQCSDSGIVENVRVYAVSGGRLIEYAAYAPCHGEERWTYQSLGGVGDVNYDGRAELVLVTTGGSVRCARIVSGQFSTVGLGIYPGNVIYVGDLYGIGRDVVVSISECGDLGVHSADSKLLKRLQPSAERGVRHQLLHLIPPICEGSFVVPTLQNVGTRLGDIRQCAVLTANVEDFISNLHPVCYVFGQYLPDSFRARQLRCPHSVQAELMCLHVHNSDSIPFVRLLR
jgi:hypothetical protein